MLAPILGNLVEITKRYDAFERVIPTQTPNLRAGQKSKNANFTKYIVVVYSTRQVSTAGQCPGLRNFVTACPLRDDSLPYNALPDNLRACE